jgi:hypothetical protein
VTWSDGESFGVRFPNLPEKDHRRGSRARAEICNVIRKESGSLGGFDVADILLDGLLCKLEAVAADLSHFSHF